MLHLLLSLNYGIVSKIRAGQEKGAKQKFISKKVQQIETRREIFEIVPGKSTEKINQKINVERRQ